MLVNLPARLRSPLHSPVGESEGSSREVLEWQQPVAYARGSEKGRALRDATVREAVLELIFPRLLS